MECDRQRHLLEARIMSLEQEAYDLAGHVFSLASPTDSAQVTALSSFTSPHTSQCFHFEIQENFKLIKTSNFFFLRGAMSGSSMVLQTPQLLLLLRVVLLRSFLTLLTDYQLYFVTSVLLIFSLQFSYCYWMFYFFFLTSILFKY